MQPKSSGSPWLRRRVVVGLIRMHEKGSCSKLYYLAGSEGSRPVSFLMSSSTSFSPSLNSFAAFCSSAKVSFTIFEVLKGEGLFKCTGRAKVTYFAIQPNRSTQQSSQRTVVNLRSLVLVHESVLVEKNLQVTCCNAVFF